MSKGSFFAADDMNELIRKAKQALVKEPRGSKEYKLALEFLFKNADPEKPSTSGTARKQDRKAGIKRQREPSPTSDASVASGSEAEDETDQEWAPEAAETRYPKKTVKRVKSKPFVADDDDEEDEAVISDTETSQKRFRVVKKKPAVPKAGKKVKKTVRNAKKGFKTITKNYAPDESPDDQHKYYFRAFIGGGFYVSLAKWLRNNQKYIQIRKSATSGANVPVGQFRALKAAILDMEKVCENSLLVKPNNDDSD